MGRGILIVLVLALGVHHTSLVTVSPAAGHHAGACIGCIDDHPADSSPGMILAACLALLVTAVCVPSLRRRLVRLLVASTAGGGRIVSRPVAVPRAPPGSWGVSRLCVLRC